mmetsp:Transcript_13145/g.15303  ORF Transcript_13145/g.15303 Transcript_13145/m.15303 type:complete len:278 (-) Transcript_13145:846-1679(-)
MSVVSAKDQIKHKATTIPRGIHAPPPGSIEIASQYLWENERQTPPYRLYGYRSNQDYSSQRDNTILNLRKSRKESYSSLSYITPPSSPQSRASAGIRNIAPLGFSDYDYHETINMKSGFNQGCEKLKDRCIIFLGFTKRILKIFFVTARKGYIVALITIILIMGIVALVHHRPINESNRENITLESQVWDLIIDRGISNSTILNTPDSPQYRALHWVAKDVPMQLDPTNDTILIRYACAVFYYSVSTIAKEGTTGWDRNTWMLETSVCFWHGVTCAD